MYKAEIVTVTKTYSISVKYVIIDSNGCRVLELPTWDSAVDLAAAMNLGRASTPS